MRSVQWQLGILGTISAFAYRHRETEKNLCRGGRSQELPLLPSSMSQYLVDETSVMQYHPKCVTFLSNLLLLCISLLRILFMSSRRRAAEEASFLQSLDVTVDASPLSRGILFTYWKVMHCDSVSTIISTFCRGLMVTTCNLKKKKKHGPLYPYRLK